MHATRRLLLSSSSSSTGNMMFPGPNAKLLLPPPTVFETVWHAIQGVWSVATDSSKRRAFEDAIASGVIKDTVLQNAHNGSTLTFSLFWNLQNPLWKKASFDAKEFSVAVGPALTNLHDFLHGFQNQIRQEFEAMPEPETEKSSSEKDESSDEKAKNEEEEAITLTGLPIDKLLMEQLLPTASQHQRRWIRFLDQPYPWRQQAADDPDSVAGCLSRMTTEEYMDGFVQSSKLALGVSYSSVYEEGSSSVGQVAILSARAMEVPLPGQKEETSRGDGDHRYEEFKASEEKELKMGVAAQIDVLYELTNRFHEQVPLENSAAPIAESAAESDSSTTTKPQFKTEHVEYTSLGVAVFEGWLDRGDDKGEDGGLLWRVPILREPREFPMTISAMRTVLPPEPKEKPAPATDDVDVKKDDSSSSTSSSS